MSEQLKKIFEKGGTIKISLNMNKRLLNIVDEMSKIFEINRSEAIFVMLKMGIKEQVAIAENVWKKWLKDKKYDWKTISKKLVELGNFKKKWDIEHIVD